MPEALEVAHQVDQLRFGNQALRLCANELLFEFRDLRVVAVLVPARPLVRMKPIHLALTVQRLHKLSHSKYQSATHT